MYRFLLAPRWIGLALLMVAAAAVMAGLGLWQLDRFQHRSDINARVDAASTADPAPLAQVLAPPPGEPGSAGPAPSAQAGWRRVMATGRYDPTHELLARARTVNRRVGFEVLTPLVLSDGTAVLVDRGWIAPGAGGAALPPAIPAAPPGEVTVVGRMHGPESGAAPPQPFAGRLAVRRVSPQLIATRLPYPIYGGYLTVESQTPAADPRLVAIGPRHENAAMNAGYALQWWLFAALTLVGFGYLARRQARQLVQERGRGTTVDRTAVPASRAIAGRDGRASPTIGRAQPGRGQPGQGDPGRGQPEGAVP